MNERERLLIAASLAQAAASLDPESGAEVRAFIKTIKKKLATRKAQKGADKYRKEKGKCPRGFRFSKDKGKCAPVSEETRKAEKTIRSLKKKLKEKDAPKKKAPAKKRPPAKKKAPAKKAPPKGKKKPTPAPVDFGDKPKKKAPPKKKPAGGKKAPPKGGKAPPKKKPAPRKKGPPKKSGKVKKGPLNLGILETDEPPKKKRAPRKKKPPAKKPAPKGKAA